MIHTLRQKLNEYVSKVPYVGNALTTEINGREILAGVLTAGLLYSPVAISKPVEEAVPATQHAKCFDQRVIGLRFIERGRTGEKDVDRNIFPEDLRRVIINYLMHERGYTVHTPEGKDFDYQPPGRGTVSFVKHDPPAVAYNSAAERVAAANPQDLWHLRVSKEDTVLAQIGISRREIEALRQRDPATLEKFGSYIPPHCSKKILKKVK